MTVTPSQNNQSENQPSESDAASAAAEPPIPDSPLLPDHAQALAASAIKVDVIAARGYRSVTSRAELERLGFGERQRNVPTLVMPIWSVFGDVSLYIHRPDTPRMIDGKVSKYEIPRGAKVAVDVNPLLKDQVRDPSIPLFITEGTKKADSAISLGLCCISLIGVWNWRGTNEWGGKTTLADWDGIALKDAQNRPRLVPLVFDSDVMLKKPVWQALARLAEFLRAKGANPVFVYLPSGERGAKVGLDDFLARGHSKDDLLRLSSTELRDPPAGSNELSEEDYARTADGLPTILTTGRHLRHITNDTLDALVKANHPPRLFMRGGTLVRVQEDENNRASINDLSTTTLRVIVARSANFISTTRNNGTTAITPPPAVIEDTLGQGHWAQLPSLVGIVTAPVVSQTGKLMTKPGYHADARLFYHAPSGFTLPSVAPSPLTVKEARERIDDLFADFPFANDSSRAHAWALLLLPFVRPVIDGPTPLHLIDAPKAGTGKGLLAQVCTALFVPEGAMIQTPPSSEDEWAKMLTTVFMDGASHLLLDNARNLNSTKLFAALTSRTWTDRKLGVNEKVALPNRLIWAATCNNILGNDELTRRSVWIRLDAGLEQPDERKGFRHADLAAHVNENRGILVGSVMTLLRHWIQEGKPNYKGSCPPVGSFEGWTRIMGGLLETIGISGFLENRAELRARVDNDTNICHEFVTAWWADHRDNPVGVKDLFDLGVKHLGERLGDGNEASQRRKFGHFLKSHLDRVYVGKKVTTAGATRGSALYCLQQLTPSEDEEVAVSGEQTVLVTPQPSPVDPGSGTPETADEEDLPSALDLAEEVLPPDDDDEWEPL